LRRLLNSGLVQRNRALIATLWRFYSVSVLNTIFGYSTYALLIALGLNLYVAQILSQLIGMTFNFFSYGRHVFRDHDASLPRYIGAYVGNYLMNLALLAGFHHVTRSAYLAGAMAVMVASLINLLVLKRLVYRPRAQVVDPVTAASLPRP
jgi:putative flippase GtrA